MQSMDRVNEVMMSGTGCLEIKSGYGLRLEDELKMLRVIALIAEASPMHVRATFLGAHAVGRAYVGRQDDYVQHIISDMLPAVAAEGLADFVDVFCDEGFFTPEQTDRILTAAAHFGLRPKIHANELAVSGGVEVGLAHKALSVDHLERAEDAQIALLAKSDTIATMLPGASFFLGMPYAPARKAVDAGCTVALASDYNPGSSPSGDMRFIWSLGCIKMRLTPEEALDAITINGAGAMGDPINYGSVAPGKVANFIITLPVPSLAYIPYAHHTHFIQAIYLNGKKIR
jgi:imidazolonepropionase